MTERGFHAVVCVVLAALIAAVLVSGCEMAGPGIASTQPGNGVVGVPTSPATVTVTFNEPMLRNSVESATSIVPAVGTEPPSYSWMPDDRRMIITYPQNFQPNTTYTVIVSKAARDTGNIPLSHPAVINFTTGTATAAGTETGAGPSVPAGAGAGTTTAVQREAQPVITEPTAPPPAPETAITFNKNIRPIAQVRCDRCHANMPTGRMSDYQTAMKYVKPGNADQSPYYVRPTGHQNHLNIWQDKAQLVKDWINSGAKE